MRERMTNAVKRKIGRESDKERGYLRTGGKKKRERTREKR